MAPLPDNVARDAAVVRAAIGVSRAMRPRDAIAKLVDYFRGFTDSAETPAPRGSVYLDLALSKKGVCRHRAFAFLITAQSLGIPARLVENEAHAWVEIHDGTLWRRIDLGGAGLLPASASESARPAPAVRGAARGVPVAASGRPRGRHDLGRRLGQRDGGQREAGGGRRAAGRRAPPAAPARAAARDRARGPRRTTTFARLRR